MLLAVDNCKSYEYSVRKATCVSPYGVAVEKLQCHHQYVHGVVPYCISLSNGAVDNPFAWKLID